MRESISTDKAPSANTILSQAIISNGFIFVSGQIHCTPDGAMISGSVSEKVSQIMRNISAILAVGSSSLDDVVRTVIYVTDMSQMQEINMIYPNYFSDPYPAREAICVKELPLGATIEISVIAEK